MQYGVCTPSFVITTYDLLTVNPNPTEKEIRQYLSGHICRCGTSNQMIEAILQYAKEMRQEKEISLPVPPRKTREKKDERSD